MFAAIAPSLIAMSAETEWNDADELPAIGRMLAAPLGLGLAAAFVAHAVIGSLRGDARLALVVAALDWLPWSVVGPAVVWFAWRVPLRRAGLLWTVPAHVAGCAAAVVLHVLVGYGLGRAAVALDLIDRELEARVAARWDPSGERADAASGASVAGGLQPR